jgi:hypothetical protein
MLWTQVHHYMESLPDNHARFWQQRSSAKLVEGLRNFFRFGSSPKTALKLVLQQVELVECAKTLAALVSNYELTNNSRNYIRGGAGKCSSGCANVCLVQAWVKRAP